MFEKIKKIFTGIKESADKSMQKREGELRMRHWLEKRGKFTEEDLVKIRKEKERNDELAKTSPKS